MAGVSDLPFRLLCREQGASLVYTEMVSAKGLVRGGKKTQEYLQSLPAERPLGVQLFGTDPIELGEAAAILEGEGRANLIDVNMGCPVRKVVKTGAGSALLCDPPKVGAIVAGIRRRTSLPVTIKIRAGWDARSINSPDVARVAQEEGASAVTLHPRTREQGYAGRADWALVRMTQEAVRIPILGSGDVVTPQQAVEKARYHPHGGVMIGRGAMGRPWIFRQILALYRGEPVPVIAAEERLAMLQQHFRHYLELHGEYRAVREFRKHLLEYGKGTRGAREMRGQVAQLNTVAEVEAFIEELGSRWREALPEEPHEIVGDAEEKAYWEERGWG
jgi:nifR3 family TIM-barrel protein